MNSEIICVGTELILGDQIDANSAYLSKELARLGINVFYHSSVGDNGARLQNTITTAMERSDLIIFTGGLGPTEDDLTKQALCSLLDLPLIEDSGEVAKLQGFFRNRGLAMSSNNLRQALVPQGAQILENKIGTASGLVIEHGAKIFMLLPGPPVEMSHVFKEQGLPWLLAKGIGDTTGIYSHTLKFIGIGEAQLEQELEDLFQKQTNPTLALLAKNGEIHCRLTAKLTNGEDFGQIIAPVKQEIMARVGRYCYGVDEERLEEIIGNYLAAKALTLATAESCTGGLIAQRITDIPGSSRYFMGSVVAYDNRVKAEILGVPQEVLEDQGAVSEETALLMAQGVQRLLKTDLALAITGIAGPQGGTKEKPVGLVFIALVGKDISICKKVVLSGDRSAIRWRSSNQALNILKRSLEAF